MNVRDNYKYTHITSATTTIVENAPCVLISVIVNTSAAGTITIADSATTTTPVIGILKASVAEGDYRYLVRTINGLSIITGAASDLTIVTAQAPF